MVAAACLIVELTLTDATNSRSTGESNKREPIVRSKHTSQYILGRCHKYMTKIISLHRIIIVLIMESRDLAKQLQVDL
jgi:hypothetical protein